MQNMRDLPTIIIYCTPGTGTSINYQTRINILKAAKLNNAI